MKNDDKLEQKLRLHAELVRSKMRVPNKIDFTKAAAANVKTRAPHTARKALVAAALLVCVLFSSALAVSYAQGWTLRELLQEVFHMKDPAVLQEEIKQGEWLYLNGENIAVIVPESPAKVLLSFDGGASWTESTVLHSGEGFHAGRLWTDLSYEGGYVGFTSKTDGYLVLTTAVSAGTQNARIFQTEDGGKSWQERNNLNDVYPFVITGIGFYSNTVGFISYRYYNESGPIIWRTTDGCQTWERLTVQIPSEYTQGGYRATPLSPRFEGLEGTYPIEVKLKYDNDPDPAVVTISMVSHDGGLTWGF